MRSFLYWRNETWFKISNKRTQSIYWETRNWQICIGKQCREMNHIPNFNLAKIISKPTSILALNFLDAFYIYKNQKNNVNCDFAIPQLLDILYKNLFLLISTSITTHYQFHSLYDFPIGCFLWILVILLVMKPITWIRFLPYWLCPVFSCNSIGQKTYLMNPLRLHIF